jgi:superfamily II DNA or RNA helicase
MRPRRRGGHRRCAGRPAGRDGYRFTVQTSTLTLARAVVYSDGHEELLTTSLASMMARGTPLPFDPTHDDLTIDRIASAWPRGQLPPSREADVLACLSGAADVKVDGRVVRTSGERISPRAVVTDEGTGVALRIERDPRVTNVLARGVVVIDGTLHPLAETDLTGERLEKLPLTKTFAKGELAELVTTVLPGLGGRMVVAIETKRLPKSGRALRPRIQIEMAQKAHKLSVVPTIVYGDPPASRVDDGRLVHIRGAVPVRDEPAERALVHRLRDELNLIPGRRVDFEGKDAVVFAARLKSWRGGRDVQASEDGELFEKRAVTPRIIVGDGRFDVLFEVESEGDDDVGGDGEKRREPRGTKRADAAAVIRAWQDGLGLVPLEGGGWAPLPEDWLAKYGHRVADLLEARKEDGSQPKAMLPTLAELCDDLDAPRPPEMARLKPLLDGFESVPESPLPDDLAATLRPYQRQGVSWLAFLRDTGLGAVLADDMGLGKTLQTICVLKPGTRTLVVSPKSVVHNWADEIRRFRPKLTVALYHGPNRELDPKADVTLTTYSMLRMDAVELGRQGWDVLVLDEAQAIKNPDSQVARAAYEVKAEFKVALSGTPVENRLDELWSVFHFTNRGVLGGRSDFQERYASPIANGNADAARRMRARVKPFLLRRLKREVAPELPPRTDSVLHVELDEVERSVYDAVRVATQKEVVAKLKAGGSVLAALEALLRLRQAACHPALLPGQKADCSSKVERLMESLEDAAADGHKALVFSQWTSLLDLVEPHLKSANVAFTRLDGSTRDRGAVVAEFQAEKGPPVMLVSLKAGGTGLNLTAADHVFLLDPWWNPAVEEQAADRAHRIGQDRPVMVYRLVAKDTVEEGILALQERKRALADVALGGADQAVGLTRDDLLALLE